MDIKKNNSSAIVVEKEKTYGFWRFFLLSIYIMFIGAFGAVLADRIIFPRLLQMDFFKNYDFLKKTIENTTIINKTEQMIVPGDFLGQKIFEENKSAILEIKQIEKIGATEKKKAGKTIDLPIKAADYGYKSIVFGFAITQDGLLFAPNFANFSNIENYKIITRNFQGEEREAELLAEKSGDEIIALKYAGERMNAPVLDFADKIKAGEEVAVISQDSVIVAFVKSVSENQILLNDYPDKSMNGALVLNKDRKIIGMYRVIDDGKISSYVIPANVLKNKVNEILE